MQAAPRHSPAVLTNTPCVLLTQASPRGSLSASGAHSFRSTRETSTRENPMNIPEPCYFFADGGALRPMNVNRAKQREFDSPAFQTKFPEQRDWRLTQAARARVVRTLENYGNVVNEAQH